MNEKEKLLDSEEVVGTPEVSEGAEAAEAPAPEAEKAPEAQEAPVRDGAALLGELIGALAPRERATLLAVLERLKEASTAAENDKILSQMEAEGFAGIRDRQAELDAMAESFPWLASLSPRERYEAAYYLTRGQRQSAPTREELLNALLSDAALQRELAARRYDLARRRYATLPPTVHTEGVAPATVKPTPKTLGEAGEEAKRYLRFQNRT